ncbi:MAG: rhomboid family intramembrane serine protease [Deltaproteobacteria bacterium]|jgi:membrane associated rhomboid family serine protease|nr:rhomboid family intramembrane serine protease [Deltaproteobacteria bacterium]
MPIHSSRFISILILLNISIFFLWLSTSFGYLPFGIDESFMQRNFLVSWNGLQEGRYWTLLSSAFSHSLFIHIFLNMFVLQSFGPIVHSVLGFRRFAVFYLTAAIVSSFSHAAVSAFIVGKPGLQALGASGAVSGLILLFALMFPTQKILMFGFIPVPAFVGGLIFIGLDVWGLWAQAEGGGLPIGHGAHLGGAITGIFYYLILLNQLRKAKASSTPY